MSKRRFIRNSILGRLSNKSEIGPSLDMADSDFGFGMKVFDQPVRLLNDDGSFNVTRRGKAQNNIYINMIEVSWTVFMLGLLGVFVVTNLVFGFMFYLNGVDNLSNVEPASGFEDFIHSFFFSVQTFTTVGYGTISPIGPIANVLASLVALVGLVIFAIATGLIFARFSSPEAYIDFSENLLVTPYKDIKSLQFRIVNPRNSNVINVGAKMTMTWVETMNGKSVRKFSSLHLERDSVFMFPLNWTIVHPIDEKSPLFKKNQDQFNAMDIEFLVFIEGYDETFAKKVYKNKSYLQDKVRWNARFEIMYHPNTNGRTVLEVDKLNNVIDL